MCLIILLVGGGICGLATALALRIGIRASVLEKSDTLRDSGAAIITKKKKNISINGGNSSRMLVAATSFSEGDKKKKMPHAASFFFTGGCCCCRLARKVEKLTKDYSVKDRAVETAVKLFGIAFLTAANMKKKKYSWSFPAELLIKKGVVGGQSFTLIAVAGYL